MKRSAVSSDGGTRAGETDQKRRLILTESEGPTGGKRKSAGAAPPRPHRPLPNNST